MKNRWLRTVSKCGRMRGLRSDDFSFILEAYSSYNRVFHDLNHLKWCFNTVDTIFPRTRNRGAIDLAIWFHDFYYDVQNKDNEERSAKFAFDYIRKRSGEFDFGFSTSVYEAIIATKHNLIKPSNRISEIVADIDLSILAADWNIFQLYQENVRQEYTVKGPYSIDQWTNGRLGFLKHLLSKKKIFHTQEMKNFEQKARTNIARSIVKFEEA